MLKRIADIIIAAIIGTILLLAAWPVLEPWVGLPDRVKDLERRQYVVMIYGCPEDLEFEIREIEKTP